MSTSQRALRGRDAVQAVTQPVAELRCQRFLGKQEQHGEQPDDREPRATTMTDTDV